MAATTPEYIYKVTIRVMFMDIIVWKIQKRYAADVKDNTIDRSRTLRLRRLLAREKKCTDRDDGINEIKSPTNREEIRLQVYYSEMNWSSVFYNPIRVQLPIHIYDTKHVGALCGLTIVK